MLFLKIMLAADIIVLIFGCLIWRRRNLEEQARAHRPVPRVTVV